VRRVLEASDVEDEGEIPSNVIAADLARSGRLRLPHHGAVVRCNEYGFTAGGDRERSMPICEIRRVTALDVYLSTVTNRQASELVNIQSRSRTSASGTQQSSKSSANHRHGPFHSRSGSIAKRIERDDQ